MTEIIKETITTAHDTNADTVLVSPVQIETDIVQEAEVSNLQTTEYLIYFFLGGLEILLAFRLILKIMGASISSGFVAFIYGLSRVFILPFEGIFQEGISQGLETTSVLEPSTVVAMIVYAVMVWGIIKLLRIFTKGESQTE